MARKTHGKHRQKQRRRKGRGWLSDGGWRGFEALEPRVLLDGVPDLAFVSTNVPYTELSVGHEVGAAYEIMNAGDGATPTSPIEVELYLSTDDQFDASDVYLRSSHISGDFYFSPGETTTGGFLPNDNTTNDQLPADAVGDYFLLMVLDPWNRVDESDETNNVVAIPVHIAAPELVITNVSAP